MAYSKHENSSDDNKRYYQLNLDSLETAGINKDDVVRLAEQRRLIVGYSLIAMEGWIAEGNYKDHLNNWEKSFAEYIAGAWDENNDNNALAVAREHGYLQE